MVSKVDETTKATVKRRENTPKPVKRLRRKEK